MTIAGALCVSPDRDRVHLYFRLHCNANINARRTVDFLTHLDRQIGAPLILIWDRLQAHRARLVKEFPDGHRHIRSVFLPPYAPELNPIEYLWGYLKMNPLANDPTIDADDLTLRTRSHARSLQSRQALLNPSGRTLVMQLSIAGIAIKPILEAADP